MKILLIADKEIPKLWEQWNETRAEELRDVGLILSAGDLDPDYLQFLVTMLNVPLLYVPGNHDSMYDERPPLGCVLTGSQGVPVVNPALGWVFHCMGVRALSREMRAK